MILTFILGVIAAAVAPFAEEPINEALSGMNLTVIERRLVAFAVCLLAAAAISAVIGSGGGLALMVGALLGLFIPRAMGR